MELEAAAPSDRAKDRSASLPSPSGRARATSLLEGLAGLGEDDIDAMYGQLAKVRSLLRATCR